MTTMPVDDSGILLMVGVPAGPGSDVPPTHTDMLSLDCSPQGSIVSLSLSRPATSPMVEVTLDDQPQGTAEWEHAGDLLLLRDQQSTELIAALRNSAIAHFTVSVSGDQPYNLVFDVARLNDALWPFDYLCP